MRNLRNTYKNFAPIMTLVVALGTTIPQPAHAQLVVTDPLSMLKQLQQTVQNAAKSAQDAMGTATNGMVSVLNTQAQVDAADKTVHDTHQLAVARDYTIDPANHKACRTSQDAAAQSGMQAGRSQIAGSLAAASDQGVGVTPGSELKKACSSGWIDPAADPDLAKLSGNCTANKALVGADINAATLDRPMAVPKNITWSNNQVVWPAITSSTDPLEANFITGAKVCDNLRGAEPANAANTGTAGFGTLDRYNQRDAKLRMSSTYNDCMKQLMFHAAISPAAGAALGGDFQTFATQQHNKCLSMTDWAASDPEVAPCIAGTAGLSMASAEKIDAARYGNGTNYNNYLLGKNVTPKEIVLLQEQHKDQVALLTALQDIRDSLHGLARNTQPETNQAAPSVFNKPRQ
jgi:hypothetical protein